MIENKLPIISIVTPSYNQGNYLEETIFSVLNQNYPALEYFIFDGGSTDGSVEIIKKYEPWLTYWESKPDRGQSHAINKGFKMATGELVAWLNSDDAYNTGVLFEVADIWQKDKSVGFIHGISEFIDAYGKPTGKLFGAEFKMLDALLTYENNIAQQSTFISRAVLEEVGYLNESYHMAMDWDLWFRIACKYKTTFVPKVWSKYRIWPETKTAKLKISSIPETRKILESIFKNPNIYLSRSQKNEVLANYWGKKAVDYYRNSNKDKFWISVFLSYLHSARIRGGASRRILTKMPLAIFMRRVRNRVLLIFRKNNSTNRP